MALINKVKKMERNSNVHNEVEATYNLITANNKRYVQINTYGSNNRKIQGIASQSIQLSEDTIIQLKKILDEEF